MSVFAGPGTRPALPALVPSVPVKLLYVVSVAEIVPLLICMFVPAVNVPCFVASSS